MLLKFRFFYKKFTKVNTFEIEAFSRKDAITKFYANFPRAKVVKIEEVFNESE